MRHVEIARPAGRALLGRIPTGWSVDLDGPTDAAAATSLLADALAAVGQEGGGLARLWVRDADPATTSAAESLGLTRSATCTSSAGRSRSTRRGSWTCRAFVVGQDEDAWLEVNNRAFDWHPEQGHWTARTWRALRRAVVRPAGFLLHEEEGRLVGFCWTKEHRDVEPNLGEIYVIAVDPAAGRRGLGRPLTLAGLDHLSRAGLPVGMLYVDGGNEGGIHLYDKLGFAVHHTDTSYTIEVPAA